jgi:hypothetical protein
MLHRGSMDNSGMEQMDLQLDAFQTVKLVVVHLAAPLRACGSKRACPIGLPPRKIVA